MKYVIPSQEQVDDVLNRCAEAEDSGSAWPGMSYEQGVAAGVRWALGADEWENPLDE